MCGGVWRCLLRLLHDPCALLEGVGHQPHEAPAAHARPLRQRSHLRLHSGPAQPAGASGGACMSLPSERSERPAHHRCHMPRAVQHSTPQPQPQLQPPKHSLLQALEQLVDVLRSCSEYPPGRWWHCGMASLTACRPSNRTTVNRRAVTTAVLLTDRENQNCWV